ncbi:Exocyst protein Sec3 [Ceraceosorus bombacis]|uniref:Exocyst protein Sec3 n=1 Tax=Ceraceosorus bombacis TaxID=401625 RepID=A0A0N7LAZ1_9BASI|nr:Exocyst protein Sec3 [Ceraceosorus bombacis]
MSTLAPPQSAGIPSTKEGFTAALKARNPNNQYIAHLKIWETVGEEGAGGGGGAGGSRKARYIILAAARGTGVVTLNKAKRNMNGSFSIGKDWDINTLREITVHSPDTFTLTLSRPNQWQTDRPKEQKVFLQSLVKIWRKYMNDPHGPPCSGLEFPPEMTPSIQPSTISLAPPGVPPVPLIPASVAAPAPAASLPVAAVQSSQAPSLALNTNVHRERSRESPTASRSPARTPTADGFYDPRSREVRDTRPGSSNSVAATGNVSSEAPRRPNPLRRPTITRTDSMRSGDRSDGSTSVPAIKLSDPSSRLGTPTNALPSDINRNANRSPAPRQPSPLAHLQPRDAHSETRKASVTGTLESTVSQTARADVSHSTSTSLLRKAASNDEQVGPNGTDATEQKAPSSSPPRSRPRPIQQRSTSGSSLSGGGDARARLSAVEPVRGGAAYERMLLAGTGLREVAEGDEEQEEELEDAYGGAEVEDVDASPFKPPPRKKKNNSIKRAQAARAEADDRSVSVVGGGGEEEEEDTTLLNVEEMLEGFEWKHTNATVIGGRSMLDPTHAGALRQGAPGKGTADVIEARLLDELAALDAANIHAIIESDDRVNLVVQHMEEALGQLDMIDSMIAGFKVQLNARTDDISHIESQNRGLQVHTSNQRQLANEIEKLLSTVHVDDDAVAALMYAGLQDDAGIADAERAAAALYKAMLQARKTEEERAAGAGAEAMMAAATERSEEYEGLAESFAKRLLQHLTQEFNEQTNIILGDPTRRAALSPPNPTLRNHAQVEDTLGRYCGLLLYAKEVTSAQFSRISAGYFASASERYRREMVQLFTVWKEQMRTPSEEEEADSTFSSPASVTTAAALRSGTIRRAGKDRGRGTHTMGDTNAAEAFARLLHSVMPLIAKEEAFISDLLHINDNAVTFADYMDLEPYFRRRAAAVFGSETLQGSAPLREMKSALELIFGFLAPEWQAFADLAMQRDRLQLFGILAALDRALIDAEEMSSEFLVRSLSKVHMRLAGLLERFVGEQIRAIEQTKLTVKKRKGVVHFIKVFPVFVERIEAQLVNAETLNIRAAVDGYYEQIARTMFDALQAMAKMEGGGGGVMPGGAADDDKQALNHHVILIENMHHFVKEASRVRNSALGQLIKRAESIYEDHQHAYVNAVLRRPLGKVMDFGDGIDALLRSTPANEVSLHSAFSRSNFKRLVKENSAKDIRKAIEALSKRVQKHFGLDDDDLAGLALAAAAGSAEPAVDEAAEVLTRVWGACEEAFVRETERQARIARDCYAGGVSLEYGVDDVKKPFANNVPTPIGRRR